MVPSGINISDLRLLWNDDEDVKRVLEVLDGRKYSSKETKVSVMARLTGETGRAISETGVKLVFRKLSSAGCGKYVPGRHQKPSRMQWAVDTRALASVAKGERDEVPGSPEDLDEDCAIEQLQVTSATGPEMIDHSFRLRPDLAVVVRLPSDLDANEAARLAAFIQALPF